MANDAYDINTDVAFDFLQHIDVAKMVRECEEPWWNQTLCRVNESVVRLGVVCGEFHWHKHDDEDEFFFVLEGKLFVETEEETVVLLPHQGYTVPKGKLHRTRAPERTAMIMIASADVDPRGD